MIATDRHDIRGEYRLIKHDARSIKGSGPGGTLTFHDLWETVGDGSPENPYRYSPKSPVVEMAVTQDAKAKNKITKRGLSYILYNLIRVYPALSHPDVTYTPTTTPFAGFFVGGPRTTPLYTGDERPVFAESDTQFDSTVAATNSTVAEGRRSVLLATTSGPGLYKVESRYPASSPRREVEHTFFATAHTSPTYAAGNITVDSANLPNNLDTITVTDGIQSVLIEFTTTAGLQYNDTTSRYCFDVTGAPTNAQLRDRMILTLNQAFLNLGMYLVATNGGAAIVTLTHTGGGAIGNKAVANSGWMPKGSWALPTLSGGTAREAGTDNYVDNFPIRNCGMCEGVACGNGEAANRIGIHAVLGIPPLFQGVSDRQYVHEFLTVNQVGTGTITTMLKYISTTGGVAGDGYVARSGAADASGEQVSTIVDTACGIDAGNDINNVTNVITLKLAPTALSSTGGFKGSVHTRKVLLISGSGLGNNGEFTIKRVISPDKVEVYETPTANETGGTLAGAVYDSYYGKNAFDGRIANQGRIEVVATDPDVPGDIILGQRWVSDDTAGPHVIGRIWNAAKTVAGLRIIGPAGTNKNFYPNAFTIQYLDPTKNGGNPRPGVDADWTNVGGTAVYTSQADSIYNNGAYGQEYTFTSVSTKGIRLSNATAYSNTSRIEIGDMMIFGTGFSATLVAGVNDALSFSVDGGVTFKTFSIGNYGPTTTMQTLLDRINAFIRGYQVELVRNTFGYLWFRGTVAGGSSKLDIASLATSTINSDLGIPTVATQKIGITQEVRKMPTEALTIIYRVNISGDLSQVS